MGTQFAVDPRQDITLLKGHFQRLVPREHFNSYRLPLLYYLSYEHGFLGVPG